MDAAVRSLAIALAIAGCSVPDVSLEGKACPCAGDYQCGGDMKCHAMPSDAAKKDTPLSSSCLGSAAGAMKYMNGFDGADQFIPGGNGTWAQTGSQLVQSNATAGLTFAYTTNAMANGSTYRVTAKMTGMTPGTAMGISVRITDGMNTRYDCLWEPGASGTLLWQSVNNGNNPTTMGTPVVTTTSTQVTMEVLAAGTTLKCCIDNITAATITVNNPSPSYGSGLPGVVVNDMHASFDDFTVYAN
jgi:hypothetical protein